jgi:hypothetical protein
MILIRVTIHLRKRLAANELVKALLELFRFHAIKMFTMQSLL